MGTAILSDDARYRYALWRPLTQSQRSRRSWRTCLFVMLNPSTADAEEDDPTIRRCMGYAKAWGYYHLAVGNLYAHRATDPKELLTADDPVGPQCDRWLRALAGSADKIIAAWGANKAAEARAEHVFTILSESHPRLIYALGLTSAGQPRHPLYMPKDSELVPLLG